MKKRRLQFDFSEEAVQRLDFLVEELDAASRAEVIRRALELLDQLNYAYPKGEVFLRSPDQQDKKILVLPGFKHWMRPTG